MEKKKITIKVKKPEVGSAFSPESLKQLVKLQESEIKRGRKSILKDFDKIVEELAQTFEADCLQIITNVNKKLNIIKSHIKHDLI